MTTTDTIIKEDMKDILARANEWTIPHEVVKASFLQNTKKYSQNQKIDIIFSYIFSEAKNLEEADFWNKLSEKDILRIDIIDSEKTFDFSILQSKALWK